MTDQGAYYYSIPLLNVDHFEIFKNGNLYSQGQQGNLWVDYVVQSFNGTALDTVKTATWQFFAIQFPQLKGYPNRQAAIMVFIVTVTLPNGNQSELRMARYYDNDPTASGKNPNGSWQAAHEWSLNEIEFSVTKHWKHTDSHGKTESYPVAFEINLGSQNNTVKLKGTAVRDNQVVALADKYEGVFTISADITLEHLAVSGAEGFAWAEVH